MAMKIYDFDRPLGRHYWTANVIVKLGRQLLKMSPLLVLYVLWFSY